MTLPVFFAEISKEAPSGADVGNVFEWTGAESDHARKVQRLQVGDQLDLVDGCGRRETCTVVACHDTGLFLRVDAAKQEPPPAVRVSLIQALAKGGRDELAVETCTELGVDRIIPWQAGRSIVRWVGNRADKGQRKWENVARAATKQSRRSSQPTVDKLITSDELIASCKTQTEQKNLVLIADESAETSIEMVLRDWYESRREGWVTIIVGPEGGLSGEEQARLTAAGGSPVRIGPAVLRSSTAGAAALVATNLFTARWQ